MGPLGLLLARVRADRWLLAVVAGSLALTATLVGAVPRLLEDLARDSLAAELDAASVQRTGLSATAVRPLPDLTGDPAAVLAAGGAEATAQVEPDLRAVLDDPQAVVDSLRYRLDPLPGETGSNLDTRLTLRSQDGVQDAVRLVDGRLPDGTVGEVLLGADVPVPVHPFAATAATADALSMQLGTRRLAVPDPEGPVTRRILPLPRDPVVVELVGIVELDDPRDPVWFGDRRLHEPSRLDTSSTTTIFAFGHVPLDVATTIPASEPRGEVGLGWRWRLEDTALLDAGAPEVLVDARAMRTRTPREPAELAWTTGLDRLLAAEQARRATAVEVLSLAAAALVGVTAALLLTLAGVLGTRRRGALALVRGRGVSRGQSLAADVVEAGVVGLVAAAVAIAALGLAGITAAGPPLLVVVGGLGLLVGAGRADARRPLGALVADRGRVVGARSSSRRLVVEALLVGVALVAVVSLRRRGVLPDGEVDPLVVAAPVLAVLAAALLVARVVPLPLRLLDALARRRRGLALQVGVARATRDPRTRAVVPLVVVGIAVAGFAAAVDASVGAGQRAAGALAAGADVRVQAPVQSSLSDAFAPGDPGAVVVELGEVDGMLVTAGASVDLRVVAVDAAAAARVPGLDLPPLEAGTGSAPVLLSEVVRRAGSPGVGDAVRLQVGGARLAGRVVAIDPAVLGLDASEGPFALVDAVALARVTGQRPGVTARLVATTRPDEVAQAARTADPDAEVVVRAEVEAALAAAPLARGVRLGFRTAGAAALLVTLAAVLLQLAAGATVRRREGGVLAAVGAGERQVRVAALAEVLPVALLAALAGAASCLATVWLVAGRLDLAAFSGGVDTGVQAPDPVLLAALVLAAPLVTGLGVLATLGRPDLAGVLREGT